MIGDLGALFRAFATAREGVVSLALLEMRQVHSGYGKIEILKGLSLSVQASEIITIVGPNGAGKSTVLKTIFGLLRPSSGDVFMDGKRITHSSAAERLQAGLAFVLQRPSAFLNMTVFENLELGLLHSRHKEQTSVHEAVSSVVELFPDLHSRLNSKARVLSGGQRRMLEIARALIMRPRLLMLDEPTIGLAPKIVKQVFPHIQAINANTGTTILMVEQNARSALAISTRGIVLDMGEVKLEGKGSDLLHEEKVKELYIGA